MTLLFLNPCHKEARYKMPALYIVFASSEGSGETVGLHKLP